MFRSVKKIQSSGVLNQESQNLHTKSKRFEITDNQYCELKDEEDELKNFAETDSDQPALIDNSMMQRVQSKSFNHASSQQMSKDQAEKMFLMGFPKCEDGASSSDSSDEDRVRGANIKVTRDNCSVDPPLG